MKREIRFGLKPEVRAREGQRRITGYAAVFNSPVSFSANFREVILPGAFRRSLNIGADVRALVEHDPALIIGRSKAGTLRLREDDRGLLVEILPPDTQPGRDVLTSLERGDLDQMSFAGFVTGEKEEKTDGVWTRSVTEVELLDVSVVAFPAYESTSAQARSRAFPEGLPVQIARHMGTSERTDPKARFARVGLQLMGERRRKLVEQERIMARDAALLERTNTFMERARRKVREWEPRIREDLGYLKCSQERRTAIEREVAEDRELCRKMGRDNFERHKEDERRRAEHLRMLFDGWVLGEFLLPAHGQQFSGSL